MGLISDPPGHPGYGGDAMSINGVRYVLASDYDALKELALELIEEVREYIDGRNDDLMDRAEKLLGLSAADEDGAK